METIKTPLPEALIIGPEVFGDGRGFFMETWQQNRYAELGLPNWFVQDNLSYSRRGILRGLHFQHPGAQGKLVYVLQGEVFDVAVDIRKGSPTFAQWTSVVLSGQNRKQFYIPPGFAHGFCVTSELALFAYKCTEFYDPDTEGVILWNDSEINIDWPISDPELSGKDRTALRLMDMPGYRLPTYKHATDKGLANNGRQAAG